MGSGGWEFPPSFLSCGVGSGGVDSVLSADPGGVKPVVLPEWGLLVVVKLL